MDKREDKASQIALTALELFAQKGYAATSVEQISAAAGIGKSTVYDYFKTKEDLFVAAIFRCTEEWSKEISAVAATESDPIAQLRAVAYRWIDSLESEDDSEIRIFFEVMMQTFMEGGIFFQRRHLIRQIHQRIVKTIVDGLLVGVSTGHLLPTVAQNAEKIAINLLAFLDGLVLHAMIEKNYVDARAQMDLFFELLSYSLPRNGDANVDSGKGTDQ